MSRKLALPCVCTTVVDWLLGFLVIHCPLLVSNMKLCHVTCTYNPIQHSLRAAAAVLRIITVGDVGQTAVTCSETITDRKLVCNSVFTRSAFLLLFFLTDTSTYAHKSNNWSFMFLSLLACQRTSASSNELAVITQQIQRFQFMCIWHADRQTDSLLCSQ